MLSRTADHLFWMARYTERAENIARMLDVNVQMSLLPTMADSVPNQGWDGMLVISELVPQFKARYGEVTAQNVLDFMVKDTSNPSSIVSCLQAARENARAVRFSITTEVWETLNTTWLEMGKLLKDGALDRDPGEFFEWVKYRSHLSRGVTIGTMLKDEAFYFARLGTFLERSDATARILDVKYHSLVPQTGIAQRGTAVRLNEPHDVQRDFYHWAAVLRSVSAFEIYRKVYRDVITPARVAELLMLRPDMPRSLIASLNELVSNIEQVANDRSRETQRRAGLLRAELQYSRIDDILATGLHTYLTTFLERVADIGNRISRDFLVPIAA
ncbi:alpha-E domain-containing protein [Piscinibacterium candidicorallinum]|uniref:Alpha-E domain-containing protein n=1 Tax=Piscinibacterium candidicorallinum TaxID=1793872 RepID=A0ABV7H5M1_9BURK